MTETVNKSTRSADTIPADFRVPNGIITILPQFTLTLPSGRVYRFDWHKYLGPTFLRADGEPVARYPSERNPMWEAFNAWDRQGRKVDEAGNCIWRPMPPRAKPAKGRGKMRIIVRRKA